VTSEKKNLEEKKEKEKFCQFIPIKIGRKSCQIVEGLFLLFTSTTYQLKNHQKNL